MFLLWDTLNFPPWSAAWELSPLPGQDSISSCSRSRSGPKAPGASGGRVRGSRALPFSLVAHTHFSEFCALPEGACAPALPSFLLGKLREGRPTVVSWLEQLLYKSKFCFLELVLF